MPITSTNNMNIYTLKKIYKVELKKLPDLTTEDNYPFKTKKICNAKSGPENAQIW